MSRRADGDDRIGGRLRSLVAGVDDRVSRWVVRRAPAPVVRRWVHLWAPLARYSGRSRPGAAMLSRALRLLTEPPPPLPPSGQVGIEDIAQRTGRSEEDVIRWVRRGLLGPAQVPGPSPTWGAEGLERARLVAYLLNQGVGEESMAAAAKQGRLPLLVIDLALAARGTDTAEQAATAAGVSPEFAERLWRAMGLPVADPDEAVYSRREVAALRVLGALRSIYEEDELVEAVAVVGRAMAQVAGAQVELFRRHIEPRFRAAGSGDLEWALRAATLVDVVRRPTAANLEVVHLRHLEAAARAESVALVEEAAGVLPGQVDATVGFADLVGFTEVTERLSPLEAGELANRLLTAADDVLGGPTRLVKTIGDAVMFTARDPVTAAAAATRLIQVTAAMEGMPPLRAGLAHGPVLRRHGDYFGRTVNVASRLCAEAPPRCVLLAGAELPEGELAAAGGLEVVERRRLRLRGIDQPVEALVIRPAGRLPADPSAR